MMGEKFIYVFDKETRDKLLASGFTMIASYEKKETYVFANQTDTKFDFSTITFLPSNKLTF